MNHEIIKVEGGYHCTICDWNWKSRPQSDCPGVKRFELGTAPENLKTKGQLKKIGLKPNSPYRGIVQGGKGAYELFDIAEAVPFTAEEVAAEKERNRRARYRTCKHCKREVRREKWNDHWKACDKCLEGVIHAYYERQRIEEELEQEERERMIAKDRDEAIQWARGIISEGENILILDTETTGLDGCAEIVQIAIVDLNGSTVYESLVKPVCSIPEEATRIHGITDDMVANAPTFDMVHCRLMSLMHGKKVVIYNAEFDTRMIYQAGKLYGYLPDLLVGSWECAMEQYAVFFGEWNDYHGSYRWQRLPGGDHSAKGDCLATLQLVKKMASAHLSMEALDDRIEIRESEGGK
jgi:DNA polymerase-3 subunit epsilon